MVMVLIVSILTNVYLVKITVNKIVSIYQGHLLVHVIEDTKSPVKTVMIMMNATWALTTAIFTPNALILKVKISKRIAGLNVNTKYLTRGNPF